MAIHNLVPGIEVTICVNGVPLQEYHNPNDENDPELEAASDDDRPPRPGIDWNEIREHQAARTVSKYIECETGKEFSIRMSIGAPYQMDSEALCFFVEVDGHVCDEPLLSRLDYVERVREGRRWTTETDVVEIERNLEKHTSIFRKLKFAAVGSTDENSRLGSVAEDAKRMAHVGKIRVSVSRRTVMIPKPVQTLYTANIQKEDAVKVHEKALKGSAKSHGTVLGEEVRGESAIIYDTKPLEPWHFDGVYSFKYRSREALKSLLVIPRTPDPEDRPAADVRMEDLDAEQRDQVAAFMRRLKTGSGSGSGSRVKRENAEAGPSGREKRPKAEVKKEVLTYDLTGDSD